MPLLALLLLCSMLCLPAKAEEPLLLLSTTSTENSGLLNYLLPQFSAKTGIPVRVVALGTGQAIRAAKHGDGDLLMVHDEASELAFMKAGFGVRRREFMYNDFLLVGPSVDPANISTAQDLTEVFSRMIEAQVLFISRADDSGTHKRELQLWRESNLDPHNTLGASYREIGAGMGQTLNMAATIGGYTLVDRGTWLSFQRPSQLRVLYEGHPKLFNQYSVIEMNPKRYPHIAHDKARQFANWLTSPQGQQAIASFTVEEQPLFFPNFKPRREQEQP